MGIEQAKNWRAAIRPVTKDLAHDGPSGNWPSPVQVASARETRSKECRCRQGAWQPAIAQLVSLRVQNQFDAPKRQVHNPVLATSVPQRSEKVKGVNRC